MELTPEQLQQQQQLMDENWNRIRIKLYHCHDQHTKRFSQLLEIPCDIFRQILIYRGENLAKSLYSNELNVDEETRFVNEDVNSGLREHNPSLMVDPDKWLQFITFLRESLRRPYQQPVASLKKQDASRGLEQSPDPHRDDMEIAMAMATANHADDIGLGIAQPMLSPNEIARERAKEDITKLIRTMLTYRPTRAMFKSHDQVLEEMITGHIAELERMINAYLRENTIDCRVVKYLYKSCVDTFERTEQRIEEDRYWLDDPTQEQKDKIRIENSILDALAKFCGIKKGGKRSRSKKRGRKSIHRRKSMHRRKKTIRR
jgi:hypothetical protein